MKYSYLSSPFGLWKIGYEGERLLYLKRCACAEEDEQTSPFAERVKKELREYFQGERTTFDLAWKIDSTPFRMRVYEALSRLKYAEQTSYRTLAERAGNPRAARAVGGVLRDNPIWIVLPCHRVVHTDGSMGGYAGGPELKKALLALEEKAKKGQM